MKTAAVHFLLSIACSATGVEIHGKKGGLITDMEDAIPDQERVDAWLGHLRDVGLGGAAKSYEKILKLMREPDATYQQLGELSKELKGRLIDEAEGVLFLYVEPADAKFYRDKNLFGQAVSKKFPSTEYDVAEAGKCLALNRSTACVFHLMRVMELGLRALGDSLKDPSLDASKNPTWTRILSRCTKELDKPKVQRSAEWRTDDEFYSGATARLLAVKDAWRNPTMHVRSKYTEEEALDIWNHVKAFMRHLATKLKE